MRYQGGKSQTAGDIAALINPLRERWDYREPFVGSAAVLSKIVGPDRIASDANGAVIRMLSALADGWDPPDALSKDDWDRLKATQDPSDPLTAFAGVGCSYAGIWFTAFARSQSMPGGYAAQVARTLRKLRPQIQGVHWMVGDYSMHTGAELCLLYCDIPYINTRRFSAVGKFDHVRFWRWAADMSRSNIVLVSEFTAPADWIPIWTRTRRLGLHTATMGAEAKLPAATARTEKVYVHRSKAWRFLDGAAASR